MHNKTHRYSPSGLTGHLLELDYLYPVNDPRCRVIQDIDAANIEYRTLAASILDGLENNPARYHGDELWDPPAGWLNDVHYAICEELGLQEWKHLTVMPMLKTSADIFHGIDFLVIYREPQSDREVILSVDLSLRKKEGFKADVLVTESGAVPNPDYFFTPSQNISDVEHATKQEDAMVRQERRKIIGSVIAQIIQEKLDGEDPHYGRVMREISGHIRNDVVHLLEAA